MDINTMEIFDAQEDKERMTINAKVNANLLPVYMQAEHQFKVIVAYLDVDIN